MALGLSRKAGQYLMIGSTRIDFLEVTKSRVRLSISAPDSVKILRGELVPHDDVTRLDMETDKNQIHG